MEIKEAIEFLEWQKKLEEYRDNLLTIKNIKKFDEVISLLHQGEALKAENVELKVYKQILEELSDWHNKSGIGNLSEAIDELKQKHFPKEVNK